MKLNKYRLFFYIIGCFSLALGLALNTKAGLGVSPIMSIAYCISQISGYSFGDMALVLYCILVFMEILIHVFQKRNTGIYISDLLQIPFSIVFTRFLNIFNNSIPDYSSNGMIIRLVVLFLAIIFTGIGAALMLATRVILNPGDGAVASLSTVIKKDTGFTKNIFDFFIIVLTCCVSYICAHEIIGVGLGTIIAMLLTGRVIAMFNKSFKQKILILSELK